jgi:hypothetical protein
MVETSKNGWKKISMGLQNSRTSGIGKPEIGERERNEVEDIRLGSDMG